MPTRDLDVVLFGATGFTGALTAEYLAHHAPADSRLMRTAIRRNSSGGVETSLRMANAS